MDMQIVAIECFEERGEEIVEGALDVKVLDRQAEVSIPAVDHAEARAGIESRLAQVDEQWRDFCSVLDPSA